MPPDPQRPPAVPGTLSPGDQALAAAAVLTATVAVLVWAAGQLAGLVFGHVWMHLDPADVLGVLFRLPHHWSDPALAFPPRVREALPGPVGMYASFVATTATATTIAGGALRLWHGATPDPRGRRRKQDGSAAWASSRELRPLRVRHPEPGRVVLGRTVGLLGRLLAGEDCHSVLVFGPPGSFKTTGLVIPAILEWEGPVLATSVKPDVIKATRAHRERRGEVVVIDPLGASGLPGAQWTPLAYCGTWTGAQQMAAAIAYTADLGHTTSSEHKYWKTLGTKLLAPLLFAAARSDRTMADVLRWINLREDVEVAKVLEDVGLEGRSWSSDRSDRRPRGPSSPQFSWEGCPRTGRRPRRSPPSPKPRSPSHP